MKCSWDFISPHPPDSTKIVRARQALTHRPGPISPPSVPERGLEWPLSLNLSFVIFPCCPGRLFVDWPGLPRRICSLTGSPLLGFEERARHSLSLLVTRPTGRETGKRVTGTAWGLVGQSQDLGNGGGWVMGFVLDSRVRGGLHLSKSQKVLLNISNPTLFLRKGN